MRKSAVGIGVALFLGYYGLVGCAMIEYKSPAKIPEVKAAPQPNQGDHPSPPALPEEAAVPAPVKEASAVPAEPLKLSVEAAIAMALENNAALQVEELSPAIARTQIDEQKAAFDPTLSGTFSYTRQRVERDLAVPIPITVIGGGGQPVTIGDWDRAVETGATTSSASGTVGIIEYLPTGTTINLGFAPSWTKVDNFTAGRGITGDTGTTGEMASTDFSVTQRLLRGGGLRVNLAGVRQARLAALASDYQLRSYVEALVAEVESTYWDYCLAQRQIKILEDSLAVAQRQADEVEERIRVGKLAETERAATDAEVAQRRSALIDGRGNLAQLRLALLRLLNPSTDALRNQAIELVSEPLMPDIPMDTVEMSVEFAQRMRPELNAARLAIQRNDLSVLTTRNGLLPQLDVFVTLSKDLTRTKYAEAIQAATRDLEDDSFRTGAGAQFSYPLGNRAARARMQRAELTRDGSEKALDNLAQLIEQDVRGAYVELGRAREQVAATSAMRRLQETVAQTELEKLRVGKSTSLLVSQAQRDLLAAQIGEIQAVRNFLKAIITTYRLDGSLLLRRAVECPGETAVE